MSNVVDLRPITGNFSDELRNQAYLFLETNGDTDIRILEVNHDYGESNDKISVYWVGFSSKDGTGIVEICYANQELVSITEV